VWNLDLTEDGLALLAGEPAKPNYQQRRYGDGPSPQAAPTSARRTITDLFSDRSDSRIGRMKAFKIIANADPTGP
jgi:hypothetical protein